MPGWEPCNFLFLSFFSIYLPTLVIYKYIFFFFKKKKKSYK